jgi:hypothetical protein
MLERVVQRHMVRFACQTAYEQTPNLKRAHTTDLSLEAIQVIVKHLTSNSRQDFTQRMAFFSLVKKVKQLINLFKKAPKAWDKFKAMLGLTSSGVGLIKEIDTKLGNLLEEGKKKLTQVTKRVWNEIPMLRLIGEVLEEKNRWEVALEKAKKFVPEKVLKAFNSIESSATKLGDFLDDLLSKSKTLKALSTPIKVYLFFQIWDWFADFDFRVVVAGLLGTIDFKDLIALLPSEGIEIILELVLPPPANGALAKLIIGAGVTSIFAVIMVLEVKYLMGVYKVNNTKDLLIKLEANG